MPTPVKIHPVETVDVSSLTPHPKNYRTHPKEQLKHLCESILEHGLYRNVVISRESTILAGHGVVEAVKHLGMTEIQVIRLDVAADSKIALKVLTGDNEIANLVNVSEESLLSVLRDIDIDNDLLGTGFDSGTLDALFQSVSPVKFAEDAWNGMPEFVHDDLLPHHQIIVSFKSDENIAEFAKLMKVQVGPRTKSVWFPPEENISTLDHTYTIPGTDE